MLLRLLFAAAATANVVSNAAAVEPTLTNRSAETTCAEVDNVDFRLTAGGEVAFTIVATHPEYLDEITADQTAPVWEGCEAFDASDPVHPAEPGVFPLYEGGRWMLEGVREPQFWRPPTVPLEVDGNVFDGLHYFRLYRQRPGDTPIEVLVLYLPDGYWRPKPLPPAGFIRDETAYGSSFIIGPITEELRPFVAIERVTFVPDADRFDLRFADGGTGTLTVTNVDEEAIILDVRLELGKEEREVAALRSMFVTSTMADTAFVRWLDVEGAGAQRTVMEAPDQAVREVEFVRLRPSQHNTSAPDIKFHNFRVLEE